MKRVLLIFGKALAWLFLLLGIYVALSFILSYIPVNTDQTEEDRPNRIYAHSNGVHLDLVFPVEMVPEQLRSQFTYSPKTQLLAIGWGDKGFYLDTPTWAELSPKVAVKAMFLPSPTAMHVTEHAAVNTTWSHIDLTNEQVGELWAYIIATFQTDASGQITELVGQGYTDQDRFYEANGNYSMFKTCNSWVNTGLRRIGVKTAIWTPMDKGVLRYLK